MRLSLLCISLFVAVSFAGQAHAQLQPPPEPAQNPSTPEKIILGKILFWEEQLSSNDTVACGTCHIPAFSFTDNREFVHPGDDGLVGTLDDSITSPGVVRANATKQLIPTPLFGLRPQQTRRRTNDIFGSAYQTKIFWDGRAADQFLNPETGAVSIPTGGALESQAVEPIISGVEMGHTGRDWPQVIAKLKAAIPLRIASNIPPDMVNAIALDPTYPDLFARAFSTPDITAERIAFAIAAYERSLVPDQTPYDEHMRGVPNAMTPQQIDGMNQFLGIANCYMCHAPPIFSDGDFHNNGLRPTLWDGGLQDTTNDVNDRGKFKTPSLRNAGLRTSFYHNGFFQGLWPQGVSNLYWGGGGGFFDNRDPLLVPLSTVPGINLEHIFNDFVGTALTDPRVANETFPFDRPTLYSNLHPFSSNLYGPFNPGATGVEPRITAHMPAILGHNFQVGVSQVLGGSMAHFGASGAAGSGLMRGGRLINISLPILQFFSLPTHGSGPDGGWQSITIALPTSPNLIGRNFYMQWWVDDLGAPGGVVSATQGAIIEILP
ncbi:MAG: cytochrome c peroxidase [Planctomycetota bacterium]